MPITTVIFDYGCVLSLKPAQEDFEPLRQALGVDAAAFQKAYWQHRNAYDTDQLDTCSYWQGVARAAGVSFTKEEIQRISALDTQMWMRTDPVMLEWARALRECGLKTAILSNMSRCVGDYLRRRAPWTGIFDHLCLSGELRIAKPDPAIYHACLEALGVTAPEALFIDDLETNVVVARTLGMHGIVFSSPAQLQKDLSADGLAKSLAEAFRRAR